MSQPMVEMAMHCFFKNSVLLAVFTRGRLLGCILSREMLTFAAHVTEHMRA